jgi:surfactin synthase thioesterase subunit
MRATTRQIQPTPASLLRAMHADHVELEQALSDLSTYAHTGESEPMRMAFSIVERELREHIEAEELLVLSRFAGVHLADAVQLRQDHALILERLENLGVALDLHNLRAEMVDAFVALLRAHAAHEERVLYKWADNFLPPPQKHALFNWLLARFDERLARSHAE